MSPDCSADRCTPPRPCWSAPSTPSSAPTRRSRKDCRHDRPVRRAPPIGGHRRRFDGRDRSRASGPSCSTRRRWKRQCLLTRYRGAGNWCSAVARPGTPRARSRQPARHADQGRATGGGDEARPPGCCWDAPDVRVRHHRHRRSPPVRPRPLLGSTGVLGLSIWPARMWPRSGSGSTPQWSGPARVTDVLGSGASTDLPRSSSTANPGHRRPPWRCETPGTDVTVAYASRSASPPSAHDEH